MYGRAALGPLRPCGFASLRQPDACGAGESVASATNVQWEGRAPARPLPLRRFRSSGSSTLQCNARRLGTTALPQMNQCLNAIVNRKSKIPLPTTTYIFYTSTRPFSTTTRRRRYGRDAIHRVHKTYNFFACCGWVS